MIDLAIALGLGLALGIVTGMPLGVVNVAIVDASAAGRTRFATGIGLGGGLADFVHSALAFAGIAALLDSYPSLVRLLAIAAAIIIGAYSLFAWRAHAPTRRTKLAGDDRERTLEGSGAEGRRGRIDRIATGAMIGLTLTLVNPAPLLAWAAIGASLFPRASLAEALLAATGVGFGSAAWFALLARLIARIPRDHKALRIVPRVALAALIAIAIVGVVRLS